MNQPLTLDEASAVVLDNDAELRAGGTDTTARRRGGVTRRASVQIPLLPSLHGIVRQADGTTRIGALTGVAELCADPGLQAGYPALTRTAGALATPQIRTAGTLGGNLLQHNRCWYYRNPHFSCYRDGGDDCPARTGVHPNAAVIDQGPCIAPHPSSIAIALLVHDAQVDVHERGTLSVADLYGDGSDPTRAHLLAPQEILTAVTLPAPLPGERAAYNRAISRAEAEWPLVEAVARVTVSDDVVTAVAVAAGGIAHTPLRLPEVEDALLGRRPTPEILLSAATAATERCSPLPQTRYKVELLRDTVLDVLEKAIGNAPVR
ncbi:FAD binding domain-containing protein [Streptomyces lunaelactis]|uniref:FAD binding domain-containing protein n=1 Tax=Streptomyces lunaelactis TaxID=1535768 RepID=UPI001585CD53|nr:FAD binding domain-containing protein [Streptomyces lunaelactis]NUK36801.1 FAD binding domain-containing protein [Streptomyces lunaelactis]